MREIPIAEADYTTLRENQEIAVYLKDRRVLTLIGCHLTETHINGMPVEFGLTNNERIEIPIKEIEFIVVRKLEYTSRSAFIGIFGSLGIAAILVLAGH